MDTKKISVENIKKVSLLLQEFDYEKNSQFNTIEFLDHCADILRSEVYKILKGY